LIAHLPRLDAFSPSFISSILTWVLEDQHAVSWCRAVDGDGFVVAAGDKFAAVRLDPARTLSTPLAS
jgi:hypothetical protein